MEVVADGDDWWPMTWRDTGSVSLNVQSVSESSNENVDI